MSTEPALALTEIAMLFTSAFPTMPVQLPNTDFKEPDGAAVVWARMILQHDIMNQSSLANHDDKRRYTNDGTGTIQLFFPLGSGIKEPYFQANAVAAVYRGKRTPSDVWFRNVTVTEPLETKSRHYRLDVVFDFTYDQIA